MKRLILLSMLLVVSVQAGEPIITWDTTAIDSIWFWMGDVLCRATNPKDMTLEFVHDSPDTGRIVEVWEIDSVFCWSGKWQTFRSSKRVRLTNCRDSVLYYWDIDLRRPGETITVCDSVDVTKERGE